jgi:hypothetical protein
MLPNRIYEERTEAIPKVLHTLEDIPLGGYFIVFWLNTDICIYAKSWVSHKTMKGEITGVGTLGTCLRYLEEFPIYFVLAPND